MTPAETYAAHLDAVQSQNSRIYGPSSGDDPWGAAARQFRFDPRRELDRNMLVIASYVQPDDIVADVGGGAGRVGLPLALQCKEVLNIEPSPGMGAEFQTLVREANISNGRLIPSSFAEVQELTSDIVLTADVTYFVRDIVAFIQKLEATASRRVMITIWSEPPPNRSADFFALVYGEKQAVLPGLSQLMPVLSDMGIYPDVHVMPANPWWENQPISIKSDAVDMLLMDRVTKPEDREHVRLLIEDNFDRLFSIGEKGFVPIWRLDMRELLITWEI